ncbi:MAG TPA: hypothetical protein VIU87_27170, partial [Mycobacterium sp.]
MFENGESYPSFYQLRVVIAGISPLVWRRLEVPATTTIAGPHSILQTVFGWSGEHLHRFLIHGTEFGIASVGGPGFRDDARTIRLGELGLRRSERFTYEYNFFAGWQVDLRVEQILGAPRGQGRAYPRCIGGRRAGPPEDWGGAFDYLERTQPYLVFDALTRAAEIVRRMLDADEDDPTGVGLDREELADMLPLLGLERFDRPELPHAVPVDLAAQVGDELQRLKWFCWHGNVVRALHTVEDLQVDLDVEEPGAAQVKLLKAIREFDSYLRANAGRIPNYGERRRAGEATSTAFTESAVNQVISKRMVKKQQMRWTPAAVPTCCCRSAPVSSTTNSPTTSTAGTPASAEHPTPHQSPRSLPQLVPLS